MNQQLDIDGPPEQSNAEFENFLDETMAETPEQVEVERVYWLRREAQLEEEMGIF